MYLKEEYLKIIKNDFSAVVKKRKKNSAQTFLPSCQSSHHKLIAREQ